jgi:hypothetical protein
VSSLRRSLVVSVALAAAVAPGTALASGGVSTPPPTFTQAQCDYSQDGITADGASIGTMPIKNAGCASLITTATTIRLYAVTVEPGWTYTVKSNGGGTNSRVEVQFANPTTGERAELRYEFGKTEVK